MKHGFTLLELLIATLISSMIGALLLAALYQSSRFQRAVNTMFDTSLRVGILEQQMGKDIIGAFIPTQARIPEEATKEGTEQKSTEQQKSGEKKEEQKEGQEGKKSKPAEKPIEKIFYGINKGDMFDSLTFITNNPLVVYVGKDVGTVKPKVVRVHYQLKPDETREKKDSFILFRQESNELDLPKFGNPRAYELISNIKEMSITYTARIEKKEQAPVATPETTEKKETAKKGEKKDEKPVPQKVEQKPKQYEYKISKDWSSERTQENAQQTQPKEQEFPRIPYVIEIKLSLWNSQYTASQDFVLTYEIPTDQSPIKEQEEKVQKQKEEEPQKADEKTEDGSGKESEKPIDKQAHNDKSELREKIAVSIGNFTTVLNKRT